MIAATSIKDKGLESCQKTRESIFFRVVREYFDEVARTFNHIPIFGILLLLGIFCAELLPHRASYILSYDGDTALHVLYGAIILDRQSLPTEDLISFLPTTKPLVLHSWLSEVLFVLAVRFIGFTGLLVAVLGVYALTIYSLYLILIRRGISELASLVLVSLAVIGTQPHLFVRPHVLSWGIAVAFFSLVASFRIEGSLRTLLVSAALMTLWSNIHASFLFGLSMQLALVVSSAPFSRLYFRRNLLTLIGSIFGSCVNPYGIKLHQHLIRFLLDRAHGASLEEYLPTFTSPPAFLAMLALVLFCGYEFIVRPEVRRSPAFYAGIPLAIIGFLVFRFAPLALLIIPLFLYNYRALPKTTDRSWMWVGIFVVALVTTLLWTLNYRVEVDRKLQPRDEITESYIEQCPRIVAGFRNAGYVAYWSWPRSKVAVTGMSFETMPVEAEQYAANTVEFVRKIQERFGISDECILFK